MQSQCKILKWQKEYQVDKDIHKLRDTLNDVGHKTVNFRGNMLRMQGS
jgi:hypothetical protein